MSGGLEPRTAAGRSPPRRLPAPTDRDANGLWRPVAPRSPPTGKATAIRAPGKWGASGTPP